MIFELRQGDNQLGFAADLKTVVIMAAKVGYLFNHMALLIDLDGKYTPIMIVVPAFINSAGEGFVQGLDAVVEYILDTQNSRHLQAALFHALDDIGKGYRGCASTNIYLDYGITAPL